MNRRCLIEEKKITLILSVVGALAWTPPLIDFFKKPILTGRVASLSYGQSDVRPLSFDTVNRDTHHGIAVYPKLILCPSDKSFPLKLVEVEITDQKGVTESCKTLPVTTARLPLADQDGSTRYTHLTIPPDKHVLNIAMFTKDMNYEVFVPFLATLATNTPPVRIKFTFVSTADRRQTIVCQEEDLNDLMFEPQYWTDESQP